MHEHNLTLLVMICIWDVDNKILTVEMKLAGCCKHFDHADDCELPFVVVDLLVVVVDVRVVVVVVDVDVRVMVLFLGPPVLVVQ